LKNILQYLKSCYQADNREIGLFSYFTNKVEHRLVLKETDALNGDLPIYPIDNEWAESTGKTLAVYSKEKELYAFAFFIIAPAFVGNKELKLTAPLFFVPTGLEKREDDHFVVPNFDQAVVNVSTLKQIVPSECDINQLVHELTEWVTRGGFTFGRVGVLRKLLEKNIPLLNTEELLLYPSLWPATKIKRKKHEGTALIVPAMGMGVLHKSSTTMGTLNELEQLVEAEDHSTALKAFLDQEYTLPPIPSQEIYVPAILSEAQTAAFHSMHNNACTLVIGPPGTGKSYTIGALAVDCVSKGLSVLIVSNNDQAVDVIGNKIKEEFGLGNVIVRGGGSRNHLSQLKKRLENWLSGIGFVRVGSADLLKSQAMVEQEEALLAATEIVFSEAVQGEIDHGKLLTKKGWKFIEKLRETYVNWHLNKEDHRSVWVLMDLIHKKLVRRNKLIEKLLRQRFNYQLYRKLTSNRNELKNFLAALRSKTGQRKEDLFKTIDFGSLSKTFPVWLVRISEISHVLPLEKEMFDVVMVDEATQCNIATILPILQRAKRLVVSGDPKQLRHVSFLSRTRQSLLAQQAGLTDQFAGRYNFREKSVLDVTSDVISQQSQIAFLNEHYRSQPSIIGFSNREFYDDQLHLMTLHPHNEGVKSTFLKRVDGERDEQGQNKAEALYIFEQIMQIVEDEMGMSQTMCQSIGVLSPYREQANYLQSMTLGRLDAKDIKRHSVMIGTAYSFQGEERDVMFISFGVDNNTHPSAFQHLNRHDVFNVSITRARSIQWIVTSMQQPMPGYASLGLFEKYIVYIEEQERLYESTPRENPYMDEFLSDVISWLQRAGFPQIRVGHLIAGIEIDVVVVQEDKTVCIDLIGYPGPFEDAFQLDKYKVLERIDIPVFPLPYSQWKLQPKETKQALHLYLVGG